MDGSTSLGSGTLQNVGGVAKATVTATLTTIGTHTITATYPGDANFVGSSGTLNAWSDIFANDAAGTASGNFTGTRWLVNGGLTGTYPWQMLVIEPSARVFAIWEHENAFTDSLGTFQPARNFETGRASGGVKAIYPFAWTSSTVALSPYAGLYADYYFSKDDAQTVGLTTVPLLQGWSARVTGGVAASFTGGVTLGAGGEFRRHRQRHPHLDLDRARADSVLASRRAD
jgi:hypothetical protein